MISFFLVSFSFFLFVLFCFTNESSFSSYTYEWNGMEKQQQQQQKQKKSYDVTTCILMQDDDDIVYLTDYNLRKNFFLFDHDND